MAAMARRAGRLLCCAVALAAAGAGAAPVTAEAAGAAGGAPAARAAARPARSLVRYRQLRHAAPAPPRAPRRGIEIPAIGLSASLATLGRPSADDGPDGLVLPVPPLAKAAVEAGWYRFTAAPGTTGNAVIAGHVDTDRGPGVFYDLYRLRPGDAVYVAAGGARQRFTVTSVRELPKSGFPVGQVFGATKKHALWLITCGGGFDYVTGHYLDNIVVSASWDPGKSRTDRR
jgi:LPXTG-site transpeptidase (sortase) family protein